MRRSRSRLRQRPCRALLPLAYDGRVTIEAVRITILLRRRAERDHATAGSSYSVVRERRVSEVLRGVNCCRACVSREVTPTLISSSAPVLVSGGISSLTETARAHARRTGRHNEAHAHPPRSLLGSTVMAIASARTRERRTYAPAASCPIVGCTSSASWISLVASATVHSESGLNSGLLPSVRSAWARTIPLGLTGAARSSCSASSQIAVRPLLTARGLMTTQEMPLRDFWQST